MLVCEELGRLVLGTRARRVAETITKDAAEIYRLYGISMNPKWFPVFYLLSKGGEHTISSLAEGVGHSHVSVVKIVGEMKRAKLVTEAKCAKDGRRTLVGLSKAGHRIVEQVQAQYTDVRAALDEMAGETTHDLWRALAEWEQLSAQKSLVVRVREKKELREGGGVRVVPYQAEHREAFRALNLQWIETHFKVEQPDRDALGDPEGYILSKGGHIFVALAEGQPVGVCALVKRKDRKYPYELAKMAVSPEARGRNIGWRLGQAIIHKAREVGAKRIFLESNTVLGPAIGLYRKLGFVEVRGPQTPYERCNIQMELPL